jgi:hypothetical protein
LHYDDFVSKWNGKINIRLSHTLFGDRNYSKYNGIIIDSNFQAGCRTRPLDGLEWFNNGNDFNWGPERESYQEMIKDIFQYPQHVQMHAVLNRSLVGERGKLEMWDPVKDVVRVEKIMGNVSFLSEFGYICTMSKYDLIFGDLEMQRKYCLI